MNDNQLSDFVRHARKDAFSVGFTDRVIDEIRRKEQIEMESISIQWLRFRQVAAVAIILAIVTCIYNLNQGVDTDISKPFLESILGLPSLSIESIFYQPLLTDLP